MNETDRNTEQHSHRHLRSHRWMRYLGGSVLLAVYFVAGGFGIVALCALSTLILVCWLTWSAFRSLIPGKKIRALVIDKHITMLDIDSLETPVPERHVVVEFGGQEHDLVADEWDYNHVNVGDEGILEYKKNVFRSFAKPQQAISPFPTDDC